MMKFATGKRSGTPSTTPPGPTRFADSEVVQPNKSSESPKHKELNLFT
jgi:hypothetical protein